MESKRSSNPNLRVNTERESAFKPRLSINTVSAPGHHQEVSSLDLDAVTVRCPLRDGRHFGGKAGARSLVRVYYEQYAENMTK